MIWHLIKCRANPGKFNMDFDKQLTDECQSDEAFFRLYRWNPYTISLGANQNFNDINVKTAEKDGIDIVKRPTGGRAILHAEELTYSVVLPANESISPKKTYYMISSALLNGLRKYNPKLIEAELESEQPNFAELRKKDTSVLCFASTAKCEVKYHGKKLIGSAQLKLKNAILQHGSILCGKYHRQLANYLNFDEKIIRNLDIELRNNTTDLGTILNQRIDYERLSEALISGFEEELNITFDHKVVA